METQYVIGLDFGTDSVRCLIVDANNGINIGVAVHNYSRWAEGKFCDTSQKIFRQHPLDYIEGLEKVITTAIANAPQGTAEKIKGITVDTTGSTIIAVDEQGTALALKPGFTENENAMFILWKDHSATKEVALINKIAKSWHTDYTKYVGGIYSSEWFWAKIAHTIQLDPEVREAAYSWVEHCDYIPYLLSGQTNVLEMKRSRCAAGHKAMWHPEFNGLPETAFLEAVEPFLEKYKDKMYTDTYTSDEIVDSLSKEWALKLGLNQDVIVTVGAFDAHMGAIGAQIKPHFLTKVIGTSTCDILVAPIAKKEKLVKGICGQVVGSVVPDYIGMEAGQSAFGDVYAWFAKLIANPVLEIVASSSNFDAVQKRELTTYTLNELIPYLSQKAAEIPDNEDSLVALDWLNGRRTPDANQSVNAGILGLTLGTDAARIFKALVEATCFGSKRIMDRFAEEGIAIEGVIALGGVANKSAFIMQIMADVLNKEIKVSNSEQTCALGAAMFAATAIGAHANVLKAMDVMGTGFSKTYYPNPNQVVKYNELYKKYLQLGDFAEFNVKGGHL